MNRATILKANIKDELWQELVLTITCIKNNHPIRVLANLTPPEAHFYKKPELSHLQILGSTVYILLYKKEHIMNSEK